MTKQTEIKITALDGSGEFSAYLSEPESGLGPGVVLIQEIFGVNDNIRLTADRIAEHGYRVCAPDLFWRLEPGVQLDSESEVGRSRAIALNKAVDKMLALKDCIATMNKLREGSVRVGVVGFCLGGRLAYYMATKTDVDCSVGYYGVGIETVLDQAVGLSTPLMLHIPENDHLCSPEARADIFAALEHKPEVSLHTYAGVGHAFARYGGGGFDHEAAESANARTLAFLRDHLG